MNISRTVYHGRLETERAYLCQTEERTSHVRVFVYLHVYAWIVLAVDRRSSCSIAMVARSLILTLKLTVKLILTLILTLALKLTLFPNPNPKIKIKRFLDAPLSAHRYTL